MIELPTLLDRTADTASRQLWQTDRAWEDDGMRVVPWPLTLGSDTQVWDAAVAAMETTPGESILVFPEYFTITADKAASVLEALGREAARRRQAYVTTVPLAGRLVPEGDPSMRYNAAVLVAADGPHVLGAKVSPQSFETRRLEPGAPEIGVAPYDVWWRMPVRAGGEQVHVVTAVCSDLVYLITGVTGLRPGAGDHLWVPANFGRGAEAGARAIAALAVRAGWFDTVTVANPGQTPRQGRLPLTRAMAERWTGGTVQGQVSEQDIWEERMRIVREHLVLVPDDAVPSFVAMAAWTDTPNGRIMMPHSRALAVPEIRDWTGEAIVAF